MRFARYLVLLLAVAADASALPTDRDQPVRIESDRAEFDERRRTAIYEGNVVITQGSLRLEGDRVTMHLGEDYDLVKLVADGKTARFQQQPEPGRPLQRATANRIEYDLVQSTMLLVGNASVAQGDYTMTADRILYDVASSSIKGEVASPGSDGSRVTITIAPGKVKTR